MGMPDSSWMAECPVPPRKGESLGAYYWWAKDLKKILDECNARQCQEREHYLGGC